MGGFTKGPWLRSGTTVYALNARDFNRFCAQVHGAHTPDDELLAVATLMQAAPDLLEALEKMLDNEEQRTFEIWLRRAAPSGCCESVDAQWKMSSDYSEFLDDWAMQISAIAIARGEA